jgi:dihydrofolate synthase / folylpolyglutamate synthase
VNVDSQKGSGLVVGTPRCPESFRGTSQRDVPTIRGPEISYKEALAWLYSLQRFGIKLGLENTRRLLNECCSGVCVKRPALAAASAATFKVIHVAGTNGKGSVCAMIDAICRTQGYLTGLFTSPHLVTFRERIRVNGELIPEEAVADGLTTIRDLVADWEPHPTFFEVTTALALKYFSQANIDVAILETGIGGRLDATNAVQSDVAVITSIGFDHEEWLGNTLAQIASEKAGIIKPGTPVVCAPQQGEAEEIIRARAAECAASMELVARLYEKTPLALAGAHQKQNAALAVAALRAARIDVDQTSITRGLATVEWPARFQRWDDRTIIDGAHNPQAARALAETWREVFGNEKATVVLAVLADKNLHGICEALAPIADFVVLPKIRSTRAAAPEMLAKIFANIVSVCRAGASPAGDRSGRLTMTITQSVAEALGIARAKPDPILITGSLHFAGEVLAHLRGEPGAFEECTQ